MNVRWHFILEKFFVRSQWKLSTSWHVAEQHLALTSKSPLKVDANSLSICNKGGQTWRIIVMSTRTLKHFLSVSKTNFITCHFAENFELHGHRDNNQEWIVSWLKSLQPYFTLNLSCLTNSHCAFIYFFFLVVHDIFKSKTCRKKLIKTKNTQMPDWSSEPHDLQLQSQHWRWSLFLQHTSSDLFLLYFPFSRADLQYTVCLLSNDNLSDPECSLTLCS